MIIFGDLKGALSLARSSILLFWALNDGCEFEFLDDLSGLDLGVLVKVGGVDLGLLLIAVGDLLNGLLSSGPVHQELVQLLQRIILEPILSLHYQLPNQVFLLLLIELDRGVDHLVARSLLVLTLRQLRVQIESPLLEGFQAEIVVVSQSLLANVGKFGLEDVQVQIWSDRALIDKRYHGFSSLLSALGELYDVTLALLAHIPGLLKLLRILLTLLAVVKVKLPSILQVEWILSLLGELQTALGR